MANRLVSVDENYLFPTPLEARLAAKMTASITDDAVATQINGTQTGPAIDHRIGIQVAPVVDQLVADAIADDQTIVDAAAAAVDANPKIATIEAALPWKGNLPDGTDIDTVRVPGIYGVATSASAATMTNLPVPYSGLLKVWKSAANIWEHDFTGYGSGGRSSKHTRITRSATTWQGVWESDHSLKGTVPAGTNLATFRIEGDWIITPEVAPTLTGLPAGLPSNVSAVLSVVAPLALPGISVIASQSLKAYIAAGDYRIFERVGTGGTFPAWEEQGNTPAPTTQTVDAGLANDLLVQDWSRRMGGRRKVTTATVAFRFDHGLANFDSKIRTELESRGFKYSLALCSGQWDRAENVGVTPTMVNGWVTGGLAEIWNHSKDHGSGDNSEAQWKAAILDGLTELRAQLPAAQIDGFAPPGSAGTDFGGFINGNTLEQFYDTDGGKFILSNHAVAAGYIGANARWQDGTVRQGLGHYTLDSYSLAQAQTAIQGAQAGNRSIQFMLHPSLLDNGTSMSTAEFISILNYVQAEQAAGRLKVVSPYEQLLTDVTGTVQDNDTGRRDITALFDGTAPNAVTGIAGGNVYLTRVGRMVELSMENVTLPPGQNTSFVQLGDIIPTGFQPPNERDYPLGARLSAEGANGGGLRVNRGSTGRLYIYLHADEEVIRVTANWFTEDPWPTTLPGIPVGTIPVQ